MMRRPHFTGRKLLIAFGLTLVTIAATSSGLSHTRLASAANVAAVGPGGTSNMALELIPTYQSSSVYFSFDGDDNGNNLATLEYREAGTTRWIRGMDMTPDRRTSLLNLSTNPWTNQWRASILSLKPATTYEVRVSVTDPDGTSAPSVVGTVTTWTESDQLPVNGRSLYVAKTGDDVNGDGSEANPFASIQRAADETLPGDTVHVKAGTYAPLRSITITRAGTPDNYIRYKSFGNDEVIIDIANADKCGGRNGKYCSFDIYAPYIIVSGFKVFASDFTGRYTRWGMKGNVRSHHVVIEDNEFTVEGNRNLGIRVSAGEQEAPDIRPSQYTIQRNTMWVYEPGGDVYTDSVGPGIDVEFGGGNFVVRDNHIEYFGTVRSGLHGRDCVVAHPNFVAEAGFWDSDIYNNSCINGTDDAISLDGGSSNVRVWGNYISGTMIGVSLAPVIVGPAYIFRNTVDNLRQHWAIQCFMFKIGEGGNGHAYIINNTFYGPDRLLSPDGKECQRLDGLAHGADPKAENIFAFNNIFVFDGRAVSDKGERPTMDHNMFWEPNTENWSLSFARWDGRTYSDFDSFRSSTGQEANGMWGQATFFDKDNGDFRLIEGSLGIDAGKLIQGFNDLDSAWPFKGAAPDIGAFEAPDPDPTAPPLRFNGSPSGQLAPGTTQATLGLTTSKNSTCRYSETPGVDYAAMTNTFSVTGTSVHSTVVSGLSDGNSYNYYVRCIALSANPDDFLISFSVRALDTTPPVITAVAITPGAVDAEVTWDTDDISDSLVEYGSASNALDQSTSSVALQTGHSVVIDGLLPESSYWYRVTSCNIDGFCASSPVNSFNTEPPGPVTMEAESMTLSGYAVDSDNGEWIWIPASVVNGTATKAFPGASTTYSVEIQAVAEDDGQPTIEFWANGAFVSTFVYPLGAVGRDPVSFTIDELALTTGDEIRLAGTIDGGGTATAHARLDRIVFTPVAPAVPTVTVGSAEIGINETAAVDIMLTRAPDGVGGYNLRVTVDPAVGEITAVDLGDFGLENQEILGDSARFAAADTNRMVEAGATDIRLATLTIASRALGTSALPIEIIALDDDNGAVIAADSAGGQFVVSNLAPVITVDTNVGVLLGERFTLNGSFTDSANDTWTATVDYDDGAGPQPLTLNGFDFSLSKFYGSVGQHNVVVVITDSVGGQAVANITVVVSTNYPTLPGQSAPARDLDSDGRAEDVNGNGRLDFADVVTLFDNLSASVVLNNVFAFDYNGNTLVDMDDVVVLFNKVIQ